MYKADIILARTGLDMATDALLEAQAKLDVLKAHIQHRSTMTEELLLKPFYEHLADVDCLLRHSRSAIQSAMMALPEEPET